MQLDNKVLVQLERLKRHYSASVHTYDYASMLDLVHALRIWTELKSVLPKLNENFEVKKPFRTGSPVKKVMKQVKDHPYIFSYLPKEGVTTYASNGSLVTGSNTNNGGSFSLRVKVKNTGSSILLSQFCFISKLLEQPYVNALDNEKVTRCNYKNWMGSEIVRLQYKNTKGVLVKYLISREILIKRVANMWDASHTSLSDKGSYMVRPVLQDKIINDKERLLPYIRPFTRSSTPLALMEFAHIRLIKSPASHEP